MPEMFIGESGYYLSDHIKISYTSSTTFNITSF